MLQVQHEFVPSIIARFGEPWNHYEDLQVIVYYWEALKGWWIWAIFFPPGGAGVAEEITRLRYLFVQFDALDRLVRYEFVKQKGPRSTRTLVQEWILQPKSSTAVD